MNDPTDVSESVRKWIDGLRFDDRGLLPAVIQDDQSGVVLMVAWVNKEAIRETLTSGRTVFWSRTRARLWRKGETSGNYQTVREILYDCDADSLVIKVDPAGPACHTGHQSCFFRKLGGGEASESMPDETAPGGKDDILTSVFETVLERKKALPAGSYVASLMRGGQDRILKKIAEEAGEVMLASKNASRSEIVYETADLIFHCLVVLAFHDIRPEVVFAELRRRRKPE